LYVADTTDWESPVWVKLPLIVVRRSLERRSSNPILNLRPNLAQIPGKDYWTGALPVVC